MINREIYLLIIIFILFLAVKIFSAIKKYKLLNIVITPLTILALILIAMQGIFHKPEIYSFLITAGLVTSGFGDIYNLNEEKLSDDFKSGVFYFILAQFCYSYAFFTRYHFNIYNLIPLFVYILFTAILLKAVPFNFGSMFLRIEVNIYILMLSISFLLGISNLLNQYSLKHLTAFCGIGIFLLSDLVLSINLFNKKHKYYSALVWLLYGPGQLLICLSILF